MLQVLDTMASDPTRDDWFGLDVCRNTKLGSGTVVQILFRMERWGWLEARWEEEAEAYGHGRPRRRFYKLTALGQQSLRKLIAERFPGRLNWGLA
jgi:DNA-binding PadR family transcriptional regulator